MRLVLELRKPYASVTPKALEGRTLIAGEEHRSTKSWSELSEIWAVEAREQETEAATTRHHRFCVNCLSREFNKVPEGDRTTQGLLNLIKKVRVEPGMGRFCVVCEGIDGVKWRLHPPLHTTSDCENCHNFVSPNGEILSGCAHCKLSYTQPETAGKGTDTEGAWKPPGDSAFTKEEYYRSHYILRHGGSRRFTLESKTGPELQETLSRYATTQDQNTDELAFGLTYRHIALGSRCKFGYVGKGTGDPLGSVAGLCLRDFMTSDPVSVAYLTPKKLLERLQKPDAKSPPKWYWERHKAGPVPEAVKCSEAFQALDNLLAFVIFAYGVKYAEDCKAFLEAMRGLRHTAAKRATNPFRRLEDTIDRCVSAWFDRVDKQCLDFSRERRLFWEIEAGKTYGEGGCIRLIYSPQLKPIADLYAKAQNQMLLEALDKVTDEGPTSGALPGGDFRGGRLLFEVQEKFSGDYRNLRGDTHYVKPYRHCREFPFATGHARRIAAGVRCTRRCGGSS